LSASVERLRGWESDTVSDADPDGGSRDLLLELDGGDRVNVRTWPGRGVPLVLLHGFLDSCAGWDRLARSTKRACYAFDLPGFGDSDRVPEPVLARYVERIDEALRLLVGERPVVVVGHSFGGAVAAGLARRCPERVAALVLLAPAGFGLIPLASVAGLPAVRDAVALTLPVALANPLVCAAAYAALVSRRKLPPRALVRRLGAAAGRIRPGARDALIVLAKLNGHRFHNPIAYDGPVVTVWGDHDLLVPCSHEAAVRRVLPQAVQQRWEGIAHHPQVEAPVRLARLIRDVCRSADCGGRRPVASRVAAARTPAARAPAARAVAAQALAA
jgi:pimeloyl-ACP methyl ester carboxylesterase